MDRLRSGLQGQPGQHGETLFLPNKNTKIGWAWWPAPAILEAEAGELLQPGRRRLLLHFSLGDRDSKKKIIEAFPLLAFLMTLNIKVNFCLHI